MTFSTTSMVLLMVFTVAAVGSVSGNRCPNVAPPEYAAAFENYLKKPGLRVNVVHLARSNAEDEELYDHVCLETTSLKVANNQYRLSYTYKGIPGFINVTLFTEDQPIPDHEARFINVISEGNLLSAVHCNPLEQIHVFLGMIKNSVGKSCESQLRTLLNRAHTAAGFASIDESETSLDGTLAQCCKNRH